MSKQKFELGKAPQITILTCRGDLVVRGWHDVLSDVRGDQYDVQETEKGLTIESQGNLSLRLPYGASLLITELHGNLVVKQIEGEINLAEVKGNVVVKNIGDANIETVYGNLIAKNVDGTLSINEVHHDLVLRNIQAAHLYRINGDMAARNISGALSIKEALGDVNVRTVNGDLAIDKVRRDINLRNLGGVNRVEEVAGDIRLRGGLISGKHHFKANGDIVVTWPEDEPLIVAAVAPEISNRLVLEDPTQEGGRLSGRMGDGQTYLNLEADGRIILRSTHALGAAWDPFDEEEFGAGVAGIADVVSETISEKMNQLSQRLSEKFGPEYTQRLEEKVQAAARRAEEAVTRAEKAVKRSRWPGERAGWTPPTPAAPKEREVSAEEQLKILQMLEKGNITPEEANMLLDALEG